MAVEKLQNGRYHRLRLLGSGGMGEVYLMQDERVNRQVAIKIIRFENTSYPGGDAATDTARLFQREAKAIAALEHPNILPLYDFGEETSADTTISYMVMPFCTEGSLAVWLRQRGGSLLSPQDIAQLVEQAADALQYAHDHGVIHLDVKSSNFLLRSNKKNPNRPTLLLADFGIARSSATLASSSRTIRGTPISMAPEQWSSTPAPATDQYALAVMAYEMLAGRPPFVGSMEQLMFQHFSAQPPTPSSFNPDLPAAIDSVILRALAKKPQDRFPSIAAFASAFEQAVHTSITLKQSNDIHLLEQTVSAEPVLPITPQSFGSVSGHDQPTTYTPQSHSQISERQRSSPAAGRSPAVRFGIIGAISVLILLLAGGLYYFHPFQQSNQPINANTISHSHTPVTQIQNSTPTVTTTPTATAQNGLYIPGTYNGSMFNETTQQTTLITVFVVQNKGNGTLSGSVTFKSPTQGVYSLHGIVDMQGNFSFSIQQPSDQKPLYFYGTVQQQQGTYLKGSFCNSNTNSCVAPSGYFNVGPGY